MATPTYSDIWAYAEQVKAVSGAARKAFDKAVKAMDFSDWTTAAEQLRQVITEIVDYYGLASSELGAQWYEYCRSLGGIGGEFTAIVEHPSQTAVKAAANREIDKLFAGKVDEGKLVKLLGDVVTDQVSRQSRDTIVRNLGDEPDYGERVGYARVPVGDTCAFCIMLASRGFVYSSKRGALKTKTGDKYHPNCNCVAVPFHKADTIPGYSKQLQEYEQMYFKADNLRRSGKIPQDLKLRIQDEKKLHNEKYEAWKRGELPDGPQEPWRSFNEITMIMRYQNEGLH